MSTSEQSNSPRAAGPTSTVDAEEVQRAKREIQLIVQQIGELSRSDIALGPFYEEFLNKVVSALAAVGGAVWSVTGGAFQLSYQINMRSTGLADSQQAQQQHGRLLQRALASEEGLLVAPHSGQGEEVHGEQEQAWGNPTDYLLVLVPVHNDQGPQGVVEVFQRAGARPATQRGYLRFLQQTCEIAGDYLRSHRLRHLSEKQSLWEQLETFTRSAHQTLDPREAAYIIANEGRRLIGCDRVSIAIQRGSRCIVEAVSGQDTFDKRSNVVTLLNRLAAAVTKTREDVWYNGDASNLAPQVERALDAYADESHTKSMAILPLMEDPREEQEGAPATKKKPPAVLGALIVEQRVDTKQPEGFTQRVDVVRTHSSTALANALEHHRLFLMPLWKLLGKATSLFQGSTKWKTFLGLAVAAGLVLGGLFYETDFNLEGDGRLKPDTFRHVFARVDGEVTAIHVGFNQPVTAGEVLLEQRSLDLDEEMARLTGREAEIDEQIMGLRRGDLTQSRISQSEKQESLARLAELQKERGTIQAQLKKVAEMIDQLQVTSPIDGRVITGKSQLEQLAGRPVSRGQALLEVANLTSDWHLELLMPESRMRFVTQAWHRAQADGEPLTVTFYMATQPEVLFTGRVALVETTAQARGEKGNTVLLRVEFADGELARLRELIGEDPKVGAEAVAKVDCGKESIGYVYLHDLMDFVQAKILFRLW